MNRTLFLVSPLALALAAGCATTGPHPVTAAERQEVAQALGALIDRVEQAYLAKDVDTLVAELAQDEDAVMVGTDENEIIIGGKAIGEAVVRGLSGLEKVTKYSLRDRRISVSRDGSVAWVFALADMDFVAAGQPMSVKNLRESLVFEKRDGRWQLVHQHISLGLPPGPGNVAQ